ncbi:MAG: aspartyl/glutamyl-tRNA(Asn/Gln) amidotransferase subunit B [Acidimicrobiia bacterium]|nr:MAG: aspartyl/glutamyl-tRNA(Asn/Gln) amidotransferase subunit B [Acidimicrobiia bacterium]
MTWEPVIGIEVHVELLTSSKMFCGCRVSFGDPPNTNVCPTCLGLPGSLPVPNRRAIEWLVKIGLALNCRINEWSVFHRKNYFYADLPKNYQISQYDHPVCVDGWLDVSGPDGAFRVGIERAHMEEDTGKSIHLGEGGRIHSATQTLLDFNRAGVPLVEIVSKPDIGTPPRARAFAQELREVILTLGVSDARLEEGSMRFDANVSLRRPGGPLGTKVEVKNMNSFRSLERALGYEIDRQRKLLEAGREVVQETRHWDEEAGVTQGMRTKEVSSDYRYFPDPDLVPIVVDTAWRERIAAELPELPAQRRARYLDQGVDPQTASVLSASEPDLRNLYDQAVEAGADPRTTALWVTGEITAALRRDEQLRLPAGGELAELLTLIEQGTVSASAAKEVLAGMLAGEGGAREVAERRNLIQISDSDALSEVVDTVLAENPDAVERYRAGEGKVLGFLVGQVMRATGGRADPRLVNRLLAERLG